MSSNERARGLTQLDEKFVTGDRGDASQGVGLRPPPPLSHSRGDESDSMGYLPRDAGEDKSGGTMRGKFVYPYLSEAGDVLTWFGRDPEFEDKHKAWEATDRSEREPEKFHFVKGFHRGLELFGQHSIRAPEHAEKLKSLGLILVEGPNDCIRLATLGVPSVCALLQPNHPRASGARRGTWHANFQAESSRSSSTATRKGRRG